MPSRNLADHLTDITVPADFDSAKIPIISRHFFGVEPFGVGAGTPNHRDILAALGADTMPPRPMLEVAR